MDDLMPPGFRFYPTEEELVSFYLKEKIGGRREEVIKRVIPVLYIYEFKPWDLPREPCRNDPEQWFFFVPRQEKEARGGRPNRLTTTGYWKATGSPGYVYSSDNRIIGWKKTMVFYEGRAPNGIKTEWKMNEYTATDGEFPQLREEFSLCRVYLRSKCLRTFDRRPPSSATTSAVTVNQAHDHHRGDQDPPDHRQINDQQMMGRINTTSPPDQSSSGDHANPNSQTLASDHNNPYCFDMGVDSNEDLWDIWEQLNLS
ncbi:hypothetical protein Vadar_029406 [Vaccinium darrowii]|uniref:Uncharacterized protein n=1 Tax=Vaccinium darrowii TaxID=229202 RepID=A0ACB7YQB8_9ERIC|nr:hypothetical protein Vadar_029406 [Vaccinium darrowii]